jgi:hypothetical protein
MQTLYAPHSTQTEPDYKIYPADVVCQIHAEHINVRCGENLNFLYVK